MRGTDGDGAEDGAQVPQCPSGVCQKQIVSYDPDAMMGHLLVDHNWNFTTASNWMGENWPDIQEWAEESYE